MKIKFTISCGHPLSCALPFSCLSVIGLRNRPEILHHMIRKKLYVFPVCIRLFSNIKLWLPNNLSNTLIKFQAYQKKCPDTWRIRVLHTSVEYWTWIWWPKWCVCALQVLKNSTSVDGEATRNGQELQQCCWNLIQLVDEGMFRNRCPFARQQRLWLRNQGLLSPISTNLFLLNPAIHHYINQPECILFGSHHKTSLPIQHYQVQNPPTFKPTQNHRK